MTQEDCVLIYAEVIRTTSLAVQMERHGWSVWVPRSQCLDGNGVMLGDEQVYVRRTIAKSRGIVD